ncbi:MAG: ParB N-terminal domain-containing protein [Chromatiaceae bacterium]|nr:ParB N-terminal domain-containing protein [Chromatiaceae bacterium]
MNRDQNPVSGPTKPTPSEVLAADQLLELDVSAIQLYDHNPRQGDNPEYQRIKASVRAEGLDQPLVVTRRPGEAIYMLQAGGNTRLRILQELFAETGDKRFARVSCLYRPWTREMDVLLAHLRENDLRSDLTFLDKALAVREARRLLEEEHGGSGVTQMQLAAMLRERGYGLGQGRISQMAYAVERLYPLLPIALKAGMGRPQVERIRQIERAAQTVWCQYSLDTEDDFEQTFAALCRRYDDTEWDIGNLRRALEAEIAERADLSIHAVSIALENNLLVSSGQPTGPVGEDPFPPAGQTADARASVTATAPPGSKVTSAMSAPEGTDASAPDQETAGDQMSAVVATGSDSANGVKREVAEEGDGSKGDSRHRPRRGDRESALDKMDLKSLRGRAWTLATRLAQRNALGELIQPLSGNGLGFVLSDVPDPALLDQLDEDALAQVSMVWWHLAAASEMTVAPVEQLLPALDQDSVLRRALDEQDAGLLFSSVWTLDPGHMGFRLWQRLDARNWKDLVDLMETYRALHQAAKNSGEGLWQ